MNWLSPLFSSFSINLQAWKIPFYELENREQLNLRQWLCTHTQQPPLLDKILNRSSTLKNVSLLKLSHNGQQYTIVAGLKLIFFPQSKAQGTRKYMPAERKRHLPKALLTTDRKVACVVGVWNGREREFLSREKREGREPLASFSRPKAPFPSLSNPCQAN